MRRLLLTLALLLVCGRVFAAIGAGDYNVNDAGSGTAISITKPTGVVSGDLLIVWIAVNNTATSIVDNNGSTPFTTIDMTNVSTVFVTYAGYRVAGSSEPASYAFTSNASAAWGITMVRYTGVDTSNPLDVASIRNFNTNPSFVSDCDSLTTVTNGAWVLCLAHVDSGAAAISSGPSGYTGRVIDPSSNRDTVIYDKEMATAGASGAAQVTWNEDDDTVGISIALRPAGAGGGGATLKTVDGVSLASVKTIDGVAIGSVKTVDGMTTS